MVTVTLDEAPALRMPVPYKVKYTGALAETTMGAGAHPEDEHWNTATGVSVFGDVSWAAVAAATPVPVPFALNSVGATFSTVPGAFTVPPPATLNSASPIAVPDGTTKLICPDETKSNCAGCDLPVASTTV